MALATVVQRIRRWLFVLAHLDRLETLTMDADRTLIDTILAALGPIAEAVAAKDAKITALQQQLDEAGVAAAADSENDALALAPVKAAVDAIAASLAASPASSDVAPDPIPVEDVPSAVDTGTDPGTDDAGGAHELGEDTTS